MGFIDDILKQDAAFFVDPDLMPGAEAVVILLADGTTRTVNAIVDRDPPEVIDGTGRSVRPTMTITLPNSSTTGLALSEADAHGKVKVRVAQRIGGATEDFPLRVPKPGTGPWQDAGMLTFDLR